MSNTAPTVRLVTTAPDRRGRREPAPEGQVIDVTLQADDKMLLPVPEAVGSMHMHEPLCSRLKPAHRHDSVSSEMPGLRVSYLRRHPRPTSTWTARESGLPGITSTGGWLEPGPAKEGGQPVGLCLHEGDLLARRARCKPQLDIDAGPGEAPLPVPTLTRSTTTHPA